MISTQQVLNTISPWFLLLQGQKWPLSIHRITNRNKINMSKLPILWKNYLVVVGVSFGIAFFCFQNIQEFSQSPFVQVRMVTHTAPFHCIEITETTYWIENCWLNMFCTVTQMLTIFSKIDTFLIFNSFEPCFENTAQIWDTEYSCIG